MVPEKKVSEEEIIDYCRGKLADYERPKSVDFVDDLPKTTYGKIDKKTLREPYWKGEEREIH
ncbi:hypothetical protein AKJ39_04160 [candidate division MSBL1 archaeon SCGC-AAA259J03]|uniref:AMP-binding enzyme C-terminal domain-containing protein n=1 Tax=candidate division MSBL1 archaeon SCGC-AAA259J03 TaxID=1698269 RepID=A0A656YXW4_9EURY|nr:hypothetical protein AKJ39_04160 [candidate division MSBL1 archaeon SCGC-AAA259J03]